MCEVGGLGPCPDLATYLAVMVSCNLLQSKLGAAVTEEKVLGEGTGKAKWDEVSKKLMDILGRAGEREGEGPR